MSERDPPAIATWLIERFGPIQHRESLTGDLIEQYRRGRSESWYWRQVITAVVLAHLHLVRSMPSIPAAKVFLRWIVECAIVTLGVVTLTWATTADNTPCKSDTYLCSQGPQPPSP